MNLSLEQTLASILQSLADFFGVTTQTIMENAPMWLAKYGWYVTIKDLGSTIFMGGFISIALIGGLPKNFIEKPPEDGLSGLTDEENLGFSYDVLDNFLLNGITPPYEIYKNIEQRHKRNLHKISPMPTCPFFS